MLVETNGLLISPVSLSSLPQSSFERFDTIFIVDGGDGVVLERDFILLPFILCDFVCKFATHSSEIIQSLFILN